MADNRAAIAHLLRRTGFGRFPGQVERLNPGGSGAALDAVFGAAPLALPAPPDIDERAYRTAQRTFRSVA